MWGVCEWKKGSGIAMWSIMDLFWGVLQEGGMGARLWDERHWRMVSKAGSEGLVFQSPARMGRGRVRKRWFRSSKGKGRSWCL